MDVQGAAASGPGLRAQAQLLRSCACTSMLYEPCKRLRFAGTVVRAVVLTSGRIAVLFGCQYPHGHPSRPAWKQLLQVAPTRRAMPSRKPRRNRGRPTLRDQRPCRAAGSSWLSQPLDASCATGPSLCSPQSLLMPSCPYGGLRVSSTRGKVLRSRRLLLHAEEASRGSFRRVAARDEVVPEGSRGARSSRRRQAPRRGDGGAKLSPPRVAVASSAHALSLGTHLGGSHGYGIVTCVVDRDAGWPSSRLRGPLRHPAGGVGPPSTRDSRRGGSA